MHMLNVFSMIGSSFFLVIGMMTLLWVIYLFNKNAGIVDLGWCLGLILTAWSYFMLGNGYFPRRLMMAIMVTLWSGRLFAYLFFRFISTPEDPRYQEIKKNWGPDSRNFKVLLMFLFQGLLVVIVSIPFLLIARNTDVEWRMIEGWGIAVWLLGFLGESIADQQKKIFKQNPENKGKVCNKGLWYYSRHPNYFFEWVIWIGFFLMALAAPWGMLALISPLLILYLLLKISGVPLAEKEALITKGEAYREYQRTTSMFIPWFKGE